MHVRLYSVLCNTASDNDTLLIVGGVFLHLGVLTLLLMTVSPTFDGTTRTTFLRDIRTDLKSHIARFYIGGLILIVACIFPPSPPPSLIFQNAILTLLCLQQNGRVPGL